MEAENVSSGEDFLVLGFEDFPDLKGPIFVAFLLMYLIILVGNLLIMTTVYTNSNLHTPMYFFLTNLSFLDIMYTSVIFPRMLVTFFYNTTHISHSECILQMYFFLAMVSSETLLLTVMAYDRYVAICNPLRYKEIMTEPVCIQLAACSWAGGLLNALPLTILTSQHSFCKSRQIDHFFCDLTALMKLSCSSTKNVQVTLYIQGAGISMASFILVIISYSKIISAILKIQSTEGRRKAFSTCGSHLTVVIMFYASTFSSAYSMKSNKIFSWLYIGIAPMCNPLIYSLKNKELQNALRKTKNIQG